MKDFWELTKVITRLLAVIASIAIFVFGIIAGFREEYARGTFDLVLALYIWTLSQEPQTKTEVEVIDKEAEV